MWGSYYLLLQNLIKFTSKSIRDWEAVCALVDFIYIYIKIQNSREVVEYRKFLSVFDITTEKVLNNPVILDRTKTLRQVKY